MARRKKSEKPFDGGIDVKSAVEALSAIEDEYNISPDDTLNILKQSFEKAYKSLVNDNAKNIEDMRVEASINIDDGYLTMCEIKDVVKEVEDDFTEIELEEARELNPDVEAGQEIRIPIDLTKLDRHFTHKVINTFSQRMREESKAAIKATFASLVGTIITGEVENVDKNTVSVSFGKASGSLFPRDLLRDERFKIGQSIRVYLKMVDEKKKNGILVISRSDENFLRCLFSEHIREVAEGIIEIKGVAREAGVRSKVSVISNNPDIDGAGSCIGPDGSRINSIRDELNKERIDIVNYNENIHLYISEALKPATVIGVAINEEERKALAVVKNDESKIAIGKAGINVRLASRLVDYSIDIKELDEAMALNLKYQSLDEIRRELALSKLDATEIEAERTSLEYPTAYEDIDEEFEDGEKEAVQSVEEPTENRIDMVEHVEIKPQAPKVSLAELEAQIENEKKNKTAPQPAYSPYKAPRRKVEEEKVEEEVKPNPISPAVPIMPIYTEDELAELEAEEADDTEGYDEFDYDEYDEKY